MSKLEPGQKRKCAACGVEFVGALNLVDPRRPGAKASAKPPGVLPITLAPNPEHGNVLLQQIDGVLRCVVFGDPDIVTHLRERGVQMRVAHFADCTDPDRFRRSTTRPEGTTA